MEIVKELKSVPNLSLALGFFDGIHLGHRAVISSAVEFAKAVGCKSAVVTFGKHPCCYLKGISPKYILTPDAKYKLIEQAGVDYVFELDFESVRMMTPEQYLEDVLVKYFKPAAISTGFNHRFGADKSGDVRLLSDYGSKYNYFCFATPPQTLYGDMISSTAIRNFIKNGDVDIASSMLGRKFSVSGTVMKGRQIGRTIGFPTANVIYPSEMIAPPYGVYDADVKLHDGRVRRSIVNFGVSPTVSESDVARLEAHLFDFDEDLYGKSVEIFFNKMIRPEIKFADLDELKLQIDSDIRMMNI